MCDFSGKTLFYKVMKSTQVIREIQIMNNTNEI